MCGRSQFTRNQFEDCEIGGSEREKVKISTERDDDSQESREIVTVANTRQYFHTPEPTGLDNKILFST